MPSSSRNLSVVASRLMAATTPSSQSRFPLHHPPFVGRQQELHELQGALDATVAGRGGVLLLTGEPGIGKTRLAEEATLLAQQRNMLVLWGRCWEGNSAPAFWPWVQIVRAYVQQCDVDTLAADMGAGAPHIAHLVAEVRERLPQLPSLPALDPEQARFSLFDSLTTCFKRAANRTPLLLVLDDLHWSDPPSLLLLQFLARGIRNSRLLVLGAYRDVEVDSKHPLANALGLLARESQCLMLRRLGETEVARLIENEAGVFPAATLVASVADKTDGNPFFITEVVRLLAAEGKLSSVANDNIGEIKIPLGVRETIHRRLDRLSAACVQLLATAAVIGQEFDLEVLARISNPRRGAIQSATERSQLLSLLQEAITAQLVSAVPHSIGRYHFLHALIRETLYEDLPLFNRTSLHRQIGEAIEELYSGYLRPHFAELAEHFRKAALGGYAEKAIHYAVNAGERATMLLAYEEALRFYEQALQLLPPADAYEEQRCEILLALGEVQSHAGATPEARQTFFQAAAIARKLQGRHDSEQSAAFLARAALGLGRVWLVTGSGVVDEPLRTLLEEARQALGHTEGLLQAKVLARLAAESHGTMPYEQRKELSHKAVAMARRLGDTPTLVYTLCAWHWALWNADNVEERLTATSEIIALAEQERDQVSTLVGRAWRSIALLELGERDKADKDINAVLRLADELRQPLYRWWALGLHTTRVLLEGGFGEVESLAQEQLEIGQQVQAPDALPAFGVQMALLRREQGRLPEMELAFKTFVEQYPTVPAWRSGLAGLYRELGNVAQAREEFERAAAHDLMDLPRDPQWLAAIALAAEVCAFLSDTRRAERWYDVLLPYAERIVVIGTGTACYGAVSYFLGLLAATLSRWDAAERHFQKAMLAHGRMRAKPFLARTQYEYAQMLLTRNQPGDHEQALQLLDQAFSTAQKLGMKSLEEKITSQVQGSTLNAQSEVVSSQHSVASRPNDSELRTLNSERNTRHPTPNTFRQEGEYWTVNYEGAVSRIRTAKGFHHLACLLREPRREFHVFDLLAMTDREAPAQRKFQDKEETAPRFLPSAAVIVPDRQARESYRQRLQMLQTELAEAEHLNDIGRISMLRDEAQFLTQELSASYHIDSHTRMNGGELEKARKAVAYRIRTALAKIKKAHPPLWRHLFITVKTGVFCSYNPEKPTSWRLS